MKKSGEADGLSLSLNVPSPTNDPDRLLGFFVCEKATPSLGFGPSHTHEPADQNGISKIIELAKAIFEDRLVIIEEIGGPYSGHRAWIDLRDPDAIEEELTSRYSPRRALLKSWSGNADREVSIESLGG